MLGALIGDIVGSRFEFTEFKGKKFAFFCNVHNLFTNQEVHPLSQMH